MRGIYSLLNDFDVFYARMVLHEFLHNGLEIDVDRCGSVMLTILTRHPLGSMDSLETILEWVRRNFVHLLFR